MIQRTSRRTVTVPVSEVEPDISKAELAEQYPTYLTVDQSTFTVTLWKDLEPVQKYTVAVGAAGVPHADGALLNLRTSRSIPYGASRTPTGPVSSPAPRSPVAQPRTRCGRGGWE